MLIFMTLLCTLLLDDSNNRIKILEMKVRALEYNQKEIPIINPERYRQNVVFDMAQQIDIQTIKHKVTIPGAIVSKY